MALNDYDSKSASANSKGLSKGFIGFATYTESKKNSYQSLNREVSDANGITTTSKLKNAGYTDYYTRLKKAISNRKKVTKDNSQEWYGRTVMSRVTSKYFVSDKNGNVKEAYGNKLNAVELLRMPAANTGATSGLTTTQRKTYSYGTYAIDSFNWVNPENDTIDANYKLTIYSTKQNGGQPKSNGSNITKRYQSVTVKNEAQTYTLKDDLYVKLAIDKKNSVDFKKIMSSSKYYIQVVFENSSDTSVGNKKVSPVTDSKTKEKVTAEKQDKLYKDLNTYGKTKLDKNSQKQNYNVIENGKSMGGDVAIKNGALIWHIKNTTLAKTGLTFKGTGTKYVSWKAKVYIYKYTKDNLGGQTLTNIKNKKDSFSSLGGKIDVKITKNTPCYTTNTVIAQYTYKPTPPDDEEQEVDLSGTYFSTPQAYAELKEGSIYNETFEAMAGVPTTRTLYFATGGSEFIVNMQAVYDDYRASSKNSYRTTRTYKSVFKENDCEYKSGDTLKSLTAGQTKTETFVSNNEDQKSSKSLTAEKNNAVNPTGASSYNTTVKGHDSATKFEATWEGTIANNTPAWQKVGSNVPASGKPCEGGNAGKVYSISTKPANWDVSAYNEALANAQEWAKAMEKTNDDGTVIRIADSDGYERIYKVGDATIKVTLTGGEMNYTTTGTGRTYSGGTYTSSNLVSSAKRQNTSGDLGTGWGFTKGSTAVESGQHVNADPKNNIQESHSSWAGYVGSTDGASPSISYTIKVTFKNGSIDAKNYDGKVGESGLTVSKQTGLTQFGAHAMCGACCEHVLPQIEDVWTQKLRFDTIRFTNLKVWKLDDGYATGMSEIRQTDEGNGTGIEDGKEAEEIKKEKDKEKGGEGS